MAPGVVSPSVIEGDVVPEGDMPGVVAGVDDGIGLVVTEGRVVTGVGEVCGVTLLHATALTAMSSTAIMIAVFFIIRTSFKCPFK